MWILRYLSIMGLISVMFVPVSRTLWNPFLHVACIRSTRPFISGLFGGSTASVMPLSRQAAPDPAMNSEPPSTCTAVIPKGASRISLSRKRAALDAVAFEAAMAVLRR
ncbi:MAG: hypothetical protein OXF74_02490 [Rhodobacteraceae bacterium]|nr:hypothetical protein [Paracoccaceae bacterium]